jgi:hypothetical protein
VLDGPFSFNISFNTIRETEVTGDKKAMTYKLLGINFATSSKVVEIGKRQKNESVDFAQQWRFVSSGVR